MHTVVEQLERLLVTGAETQFRLREIEEAGHLGRLVHVPAEDLSDAHGPVALLVDSRP